MNLSRQRGFTLVELMLAMAFVSALLLAIAMTVIQIGNIYNRGITYKNVNQVGSSLVSELQRGIASSAPFKVFINDVGEGEHYIKKDWGGRLCTGQYSYIWNYGKAIKNPALTNNKYSDPDSDEAIRFIKVLDSNKNYCAAPDAFITKSDAVELLNDGQSDLAIHSFSIGPYDDSTYDLVTHQRLYNISFLLGTNDQDALDGSDNSCRLANEANSDPTYCAVNQFDIVVRAGNEAAE